LDPVHVGTVTNPLINIHSTAVPSADGKTLMIVDEEDDIALCEPGGHLPLGALWFYDITNVQKPVLRGYLGPQNTFAVGVPYFNGETEECSAFGVELVPGQDRAVVSWISAGTSVVDFSDPSKPFTVGWNRPDGAAATAAQIVGGAIVASDENRGLDVFSTERLPA
jgi:hypothetical protein